MNKYNPQKIEKKWQEQWEKEKIYNHQDDYNKKKYYILDMFPYPSGDGLHMGHTESYTASDIIYRFKKLQGYDVLHPQGFDSFGLPAENYAIKTGTHPKETTRVNAGNYIKQMKMLGLGHDLDHLAYTSDPSYYKWTQFLFGKFFENNILVKRTDKINWCSSCNTGIANEQVEDGKCERCKTEIKQKEIPGWFFKITDFADELIQDLDKVDWPEATKKNQRAWIGKSEGAKIKFAIKNGELEIKNNISNVVLVHGWGGSGSDGWFTQVKNYFEKMGVEVIAPSLPNTNNPQYREWKEYFDKNITFKLNEQSIFIGHSLGPSFFMRYLQESSLTINRAFFVAPVLHNRINELDNFFENDFDFKKIKQAINKITVIGSDNDPYIPQKDFEELSEKLGASFQLRKNREHFSQNEKTNSELIDILNDVWNKENNNNFELEVFTTRPDTLFGATYMVIAPEHSLIKNEELKIENYKEVDDYVKKAKNKTELERMENKEKTGVELKGIKAINPANNEEIPIFVADYVLGGYGTGAIMAVPAHDERDFEFAQKNGIKIEYVIESKEENFSESVPNGWSEELAKHKELTNGSVVFAKKGVLINSDKFDGMTSTKAGAVITKFVGGKMTSNYRLRDWSISRQRYWGCPIPIVYSPDGEAKFVGRENLPWILPEDVDFVPTGTAPLAKSKELKERVEKLFGKGWTPEVDTMDTFVDSSWYFFRYPDTENEKEFCSQEKLKRWMPVDLYIGGAEHTYMHLLYARFFVKAMKRIGLIEFDEPFIKLRHQGMVLDAKGKKMSKSKGNVINPNDMVEKFGADAVRLYMMFVGPLEDDVMFKEDGVTGVYRFLEKVWKIYNERDLIDCGNDCGEVDKSIPSLFHKTVKKVSEDIESLGFNTAISQMMIFINACLRQDKLPKSAMEKFLILLSPFAPHITEELWANLGNTESIFLSIWPEYNPKMIADETISLVVQVNGKVRDTLKVPADISEVDAKKLALDSEKVQKWTKKGGKIRKIIYVKGKLVSVVV